MPSKASRRHDTIYNQVQYLGCHLIKYSEAAARTTRVYPIMFGMKRKTTLWLINGLDDRLPFLPSVEGMPFDNESVLPFFEEPFCIRDGEFGIMCVNVPECWCTNMEVFGLWGCFCLLSFVFLLRLFIVLYVQIHPFVVPISGFRGEYCESQIYYIKYILFTNAFWVRNAHEMSAGTTMRIQHRAD